MANPYTSQAISGYNTSPPADDGTQVSTNQVKWATHKTKLADPIKTLAEAINTELVTAFATVDDASNLTTGELPDARLSSNVPLINAANEFTADQKISNTSPSLQLEETDGGTDAKLWDVAVNGEIFSISTRTDAGASGESFLTVSRSGTAVGTVNFPQGTVQVSSADVLTEDVIAALTAIDVSGLAATDGIYVDDAGTAKRASIQSLGVRVVDASAANQTFALGDGNSLQTIGATSRTFTIPPNSSVAFPIGVCIYLSSTGAGEITVDPGAGVTLNSVIAQASTANRTVLAGGIATLVKTASDTWSLTGDIS